jgi:hypothetical protein
MVARVKIRLSPTPRLLNRGKGASRSPRRITLRSRLDGVAKNHATFET